jgi:hypothetical protein
VAVACLVKHALHHYVVVALVAGELPVICPQLVFNPFQQRANADAPIYVPIIAPPSHQ